MRQGDLADALADPAVPPPRGLSDGHGRAALRRFAVYRNNVAVSLGEALEAAFPVVARLVGPEFFRAAAQEFIRAHPPRSPRLALWGDGFPGFLAQFPPAGSVPFLSDVARLEQAMRASYHAADAVPIDVAALRLPAERLVRARLSFAPAVRLVRSHWPVASIWRANVESGSPPQPGGEDVLVARPALDPMLRVLPPGGGAVLARLLEGARVEDAAEQAPLVDLGALFAALLEGGAIVDVREDSDWT